MLLQRESFCQKLTIFINHKNIYDLAFEISKVKNNRTPKTVNIIFFKMRLKIIAMFDIAKTLDISRLSVYYSSKSILNLGPNTYSIVSQEFRQINFLNKSKKSVRKWIPGYWSL